MKLYRRNCPSEKRPGIGTHVGGHQNDPQDLGPVGLERFPERIDAGQIPVAVAKCRRVCGFH